MSSSSLQTSKLCFNSECSEFKPERFRPAWRFRNGDFADLCDRCASAYEEGRFCDVYHLKSSGWRTCESCGKRIHCGCIVSASAFMLLDAGGVECLACTRRKASLGLSFSRPPPSFFFQPPIAEKFKDLSVKDWSSSAGSGQVNCCQVPNSLGPCVLQFDFHNHGVQHATGQPTSRDRASSMGRHELEDSSGKHMSESSKIHASSILENGKGTNCEDHPSPAINSYKVLNPLKDDPCRSRLAFPGPVATPNDTNGHIRLIGPHLWQTSPLNHSHNDLNSGVDSPCESESRNMTLNVDSQLKHRVLPRYWPRFTNQDLQNLSTDSKSVITPLFEKMLSASDAGRIGRLVLPKKCAEAYLPQISQPEGLPLKVQDSTGKEWIFQFRFWPNNNSRMYVLEGVTACIQNMRLQAGDTVTFSRLDPEGKLIMGFRKASVAQSSDQVPGTSLYSDIRRLAAKENDSIKSGRDTCSTGDAEPADPRPLSKAHKSAYIAKEALAVKSSSRKKKKSSMMILKSKRRRVEKEDFIELKLTWEEAQGLLQPPPNSAPSIIVIEGFEFEEYEDAPIIGRPTVFATDDTGTGCSAAQELASEQVDNIHPPHNSDCSKVLKASKEESHDMETIEEIGEGLSMSSKTTTRHPRHRPGCTCIVCIQPPSGKGPKHEPGCTCAVCQMVKRRFRTLMLRREKKQTEKKDNKRKESLLLSSDEELNQCQDHDDKTRGNSSSTPPFKGQIDLNTQPEKDEESSPLGSDSTAMRRLPCNVAMEEACFDQLKLSSECSHGISVTNQISPKDGVKPVANTVVSDSNTA
ncbi:PREDICTED: B3 domain-containing transcription factor VAL3 isoform X2 [Tarenaya hassleriana]|uniref:B3 domain-containing transcription factor VAL3 isoform X2 n=1 Tax=Tarenaya hassleriana TaxID=28532 RepID=UPI00053C278B|nr:PREDICTED: B3 domain-containing transcription factor VAL3 isoform X2 [Tarenaya hassleriana]